MAFADRRTAGQALAQSLAQALAERQLTDPVVLALPRGGVPVGAEIARALGAPLDLVLVRKIGVPYQPELAAAAVVDGADAELVTNDEVVTLTGTSRGYLERAMQRELAEIERRRKAYLRDRPRVPLEGRTLILVDDGIATGASVRAALKALRRRKPKALILAVPVAPADTIQELRGEVDDIVCLAMPHPFTAIGLHYRDFRQLSDRDVLDILDATAGDAARPEGAPPAPAGR